MSNEKEVIAEKTNPPSEMPKKFSSQATTKSRLSWFLWLMSGISVGIITVSIYLFFVRTITLGSFTVSLSNDQKFIQQLQQHDIRLTDQESTLDELADKLQALQEKVTVISSPTTMDQADIHQIESQLQELKSTLQTMQESSLISSTEETLPANFSAYQASMALAAAYVAFSQQQTLSSVRGLLQNAETALNAMQDDGLSNVKENVKQLISELDAASLPEIDQVYSQLNQLAEKLQTLPTLATIQLDSIEKPRDAVDATTSNEQNTKHESLQTIWQRFNALIKIEPRKPLTELLIHPEEENLMQLKFAMILEEVKLALMQRHAERYKESLAHIENLVMTYFPESEARQMVLQDVRTLSSITITGLANLLPTLQELLAYLSKR